PSLNGAPSTGNPTGIFPNTSPPIAPSSSDGNLTQGVRQVFGPQLIDQIPTVATFTGILTDPQFRVAINALQQRDGTDELTAPEVTTESGRQAQIQAVDLITIVTGTSLNAPGQASFAGTQTGVNSPILAPAIANQPTTQILPFGPTLDVIPYVSADEFSVQM